MARTTPLLIALALAFASLELSAAFLGPYGLFHDELYYWVGAQHLELGYVDHPPLAPWLLAATTTVFGDGRFSFALVPALCGAATIVLTGLMAARLGAGRFGQLLAALSIITAPVVLVFSSFYSVNAIEFLLWTATCYLVIELIRTGDERRWLIIGLVAGVALLNKHTYALLLFGLAVGFLATSMRPQIRSRWFWLGCLFALLLALPNLYWNFENGWPSLVFYRSRDEVGNIPTSVAQALALQVLSIGPLAPLVWVPGILFLLRRRDGQSYRLLGIAFLTLLAVMLLSGQRRPDRIAGAYPMVLAAGAVYWDQRHGSWGRRIRWLVVGLVLLSGAVALPVTLPLLSPERVADYYRALGTMPDIEKADVGQSIPNYFLGRLEWEEFANQVIGVWESLPDEDRRRSAILVPHWVFGSVIEYYGRNRNLPPVIAPHNAYYFWRREAAGREVVLSVGVDAAALAPHFADTTQLARTHCKYCGSFARESPDPCISWATPSAAGVTRRMATLWPRPRSAAIGADALSRRASCSSGPRNGLCLRAVETFLLNEAEVVKVTVLLPVYNREAYLGAAIESVLAQTLSDLELLVIDDGSTDGSAAICRAVRDQRVHLLSHPHAGISAAMNAGLRAARGTYVARLDSDDIWLPDMLATQIAALDAHPEFGAVYGKAEGMDVTGTANASMRGFRPHYPEDDLRSLLYDDFTCNITVVARRECFERAGDYDETMSVNEDWDMWLRVARHDRFAFTDRVVARFRCHAGNITHPHSPAFRESVEGRNRVLDKFFARGDLSAAVMAMRPVAHRNVYVAAGLRWFGQRRYGDAMRTFARAVRVSERSLHTSALIAMRLFAQEVLSRFALGRSLATWQVVLRRRWRARSTEALR